MPNRILKETVCTSENIELLSPEAERFFYRLMVQCDDYGRMDARISVLRARCFPLKLDTVLEIHVRAWLNELVEADLIRLYTHEGRPYLRFVTWERHQQIRAKKSKFPAPPTDASEQTGLISDDINGNHLTANVTENPIQSNTNTTRDDVFVLFENEIGLITPTVANEIESAEKDYPAVWLEEAIKTAAKANKRSWNYVAGILRRWKAEGKSDLTPRTGQPRVPTPTQIILPDGTITETML